MSEQLLEDIDLSGGEEQEDTPIKEEDQIEQTEEPEQDQIEESEQETEQEITNVTQLAEEFGVEPSAIYELEVPMGDGIESVSLSVLKDAYQNQQRGSDELVEERKAFDQEKIDYNTSSLASQNASTQNSEEIMSSEAELRSINDSFNSIDWALFEREQPAESVLQKQKFQEAFNHALVKKNTAIENQEIEKSQRVNAYNVEQASQLRTSIPEWQKESVYKEEKSNIRSMLTEYGFTEADINSLRDAKSIRLVNDLARLKNSISNAKPIPTKSASAVLKTGSLRRVAKSKDTDINKMIQRASKSKDKRIKADAVAQLLQI